MPCNHVSELSIQPVLYLPEFYLPVGVVNTQCQHDNKLVCVFVTQEPDRVFCFIPVVRGVDGRLHFDGQRRYVFHFISPITSARASAFS